MSGELTLREKIGQMLLVGFRGYTVQESDPIVRDIVERHIGGIILFDQEMADTSIKGRNIQSPAQVAALTASLQAHAKNPLLIATDQEGGRVNRLKAAYGFPETISHEELGSRPSEETYAEAAKIARALKSVGLNFNLAPVVDLDLAPDNPIIKGKKRSFGADPFKVAQYASQFVAAHRAEEVLTCLKHFPGHGSARGDTHLGLVNVTDSWDKSELLPFKLLIADGWCDAIMTAHVFNAHLDPERPATLSRAVVQGLLSGQLGFDGVVLSDDLEMKAISSQYGLPQAIEFALEAGIDVLCFGNNMNFDPEIGRKASDIIYQLVDSGKIALSRIDDSCARVQRLKQKFKLR
ncbi:MAG TPA: glycoside hydrolase family 3 N-terminal domain-containing protein [Verrucomicrobiae bacterium]|jgi:beta-N-acetylhexosaminidase|nr:glycoside hydrolase family 3 N-terminal domain-containing protein [Verrucomicrobiae bacterium]